MAFNGATRQLITSLAKDVTFPPQVLRIFEPNEVYEFAGEHMAASTDQSATVIGLNRFGLGARPGDLAMIGKHIREALLEDVAAKAASVDGAGLLTSAEAFHRLRLEREEIKAMRVASADKSMQDRPDGKTTAPASLVNPESAGMKAEAQAKNPLRRIVRDTFQAETLARLEAAKQAKTGFAERLALFWSNHFCISARKAGVVRIMAGAYEREAIRPHVFGRFVDILLAVEEHPAMLVYLDNEQSMGPKSPGGQRQQKGLNENFAREIMELHTLGVDGGYTQEDVTSLARVLTGWRFARKEGPLGDEGRFVFNPNLHEPGIQRVMGIVYQDGGRSQGEEALRALARHPATARHIARKLTAHFVGGGPESALAGRLEKVFRDTEGDLSAVSRALIEAPESWTKEPSKLRTPYEFLAALVRATGVAMKALQVNGALNSMGQPLWSPPGPNGFPDENSAWLSPEGVKARLDFSARLAQSVEGQNSPSQLLDEIIGPTASDETRTAVARAQSRAQGFALLLMSPEFQRR